MRPLAVLLATLSIIVGCSGGQAPASATPGAPGPPGSSPAAPTVLPAATGPVVPPGAVDACALLTEDDILQASGFGVLTTTPGPQLGIFPDGCSIELDAPDAVVPPDISIGVISPGGRDYFRRFFVEPFPDAEHVSGIGDDAIRSDTGGLMAVKGDTLVNIEYFSFGEEVAAVVEALMRSALARA